MQKLYSQIIGMPLFVEYRETPIALVRDVVLDPETGKVVAFMVKRNQCVVPRDIEQINARGILIQDADRITPVSDIMRVAAIATMRIPIISQRVMGKNTKQYIGRVFDYEIEFKTMTLSKLFVSKMFFFVRFNERIFPYAKIIEMTPKHIIVNDKNTVDAVVDAKIPAPSSAFA